MPPEAPLERLALSGLRALDSRAAATLLKGLGRCGLAPRARELFDLIRSLPPEHEARRGAGVCVCWGGGGDTGGRC